MSQLKVNTIRHTSASSDAITLVSDGTATAKITNNLSNRNLVINGAFQVFQRGSTSTSSGFQTSDRIAFYRSGLEENTTQEIASLSSGTTPYNLGFRTCLKLTNGNQASGANVAYYQFIRTRLEAMTIAKSGWNYTSTSSYITLSFWVKSSVAQNFFGYLETSDGTQKQYPFETGSLTANTWTKIVKKIPGHADLQFDNSDGTGLGIILAPYFGTNYTNNSASVDTWAAQSDSARQPDNTTTWFTTNDATFETTGWQLEVGDTATDFEHRTYGDDLAKCQRYYVRYQQSGSSAYWVTHITGYGSSNNSGVIYFPVPMRTAPTSLETTSTAADYQFWGASTVADSSALPVIRGSAGLNHQTGAIDINGAAITEGHSRILRIKGSTNAYLGFSAEL